MKISDTAKKKLAEILPKDTVGFSVTGFVGTCRGSTPVIIPADAAQAGQKTVECEGLLFFVAPEIADDFSACLIDYDGAFFGKGLTATWPHRPGCNCHS